MTDRPPPAAGPRRIRITPAWSILLATLFGAALRCDQIGSQILGDDEWHALYALTFDGYGSILRHFGVSDYSIPLTLLYKALAQNFGLTEMVMRAPMLVCGAGALLLLPLLAGRQVGGAAAASFAWLLAVAPLHVYFSRTARPYAITLLLACVSAFAFHEWLAGGRRRLAIVYAGCAILAPWLHLAVLPFVLAPLAFAFAERLLRGSGPRRAAELAALAGSVAAGLALVLGPPLAADAGSLAGKAGTTLVRLKTLEGAAQLFAGTGRPWVVAAFFALAAAGCASLARRRPRLLAYLATLAAAQAIVSLSARPFAIEAPIVLARYLLPLLVLLLLAVAAAVAEAEALVASRLPSWPSGALGLLLAAVLFVLGPLPAIHRRPNDWTNHGVFQYTYDETSPYSFAPRVRPHRVPDFYRQLAVQPPGAVLIVEAPWYYPWLQNPYPCYQAVHRQRMIVGFVAPRNRYSREGELPRGSGLLFRNAAHVNDEEGLRRRGARYVVFHRHLDVEFPQGAPEPVDVAGWIEEYRSRHPIVYQDEFIVVFDLSRS